MKKISDDAWREHAGLVAWPTALLFAAVVLAHGTAWLALLLDLAHPGLAVALSTLAAYGAFTVLHEAAHGNIHGRDERLRRGAEVLGWVSGLLLLAPYPAFRVLHLRHHSRTNDPEHDPDYWVKSRGPLAVLARCYTILPHYWWQLLVGPASRTPGGVAARPTSVAVLLALALGVASLAYADLLLPAVLAWLLPALLASGVLAFLFDWLPHHPHEAQGRFRDTRAVDLPGLFWPMLGQNLHLVHHLYPRVPFYRYRRCFEAVRPRLAQEGSPIVGRPAPGTPGAEPTRG